MDVDLQLYFADALRIVVGFVFLLSSSSKVRRPAEFARMVMDYRVLPPLASQAFAYVLIPTEVFLGLAFLSGRLWGVALWLAIGVLMLFLAAVGINLRRGRKVACGCFGRADERLSGRTLARLLLLLAALVAVGGYSVIHPGRFPVSPSSLTLPYLVHVLVFAVFLMVLAAWALSAPELFRVLRARRG